MSVLKAGFTLGFGLIMSMGPQNVFLIRQGFKKEYPYLVALVCSLCDTLLILFSSLSISQLVLHYPTARMIMMWLGAAFLLGYGAKSIYSGVTQLMNTASLNLSKASAATPFTKLLFTTLSFSLFNPQAIIDTMIIIGGVINEHPKEDHFMFITGVIGASFLWFAGLATLSSRCANYLKNKKIWSTLEITSGIIMLGFGISML